MASPSARRPNFLLIITDQQRGDHASCYGNKVLKTPGIDRIAAGGVRFDRFHVASPVCMPNRATLMTGRLPSLHGVRFNGVPLPLGTNTFVEVMRTAGWRTALVGKSHLQNLGGIPAALERVPTEAGLAPPPSGLDEAMKDDPGPGRYDQEDRIQWRNPDWHMEFPYYGFQHVDLCVGHAARVVGSYGHWLAERHPNADALRGPENQLPGNTYVLPQSWRTRIPEELYPTTYVTEKTIAYLEEHARSHADEPFMIQCSYPDPHHPFTPPGKYWDMYKAEDMPLPISYDAKGGTPPPNVAKLLAERDNGTRKAESQAAFAVTPREAKEGIALTYGMISMIDDGVQKILDRLDALGLAENTVVMYTADHGDMMGDHQLMLKGSLAYQGLVRVPFIWSDPALPKARTGVSTDALFGTLDIGASIMKRAGLGSFNGMQGRSFLPVIDGSDKKGRDAVLIEYGSQRAVPGGTPETLMRTLVTGRHRITYYRGVPWGELYDLVDDPNEMFNLWDDPAAAKVKAEMTEALLRETMAMAETSPHPKALA
jgi:arylsulfatase A-like enzyme